MNALSNFQKRQLVLLLLRAWDRAEQGKWPGGFDEFRHAHVEAACGKGGLRLCLQGDYAALMAHANHLIGEDGEALRWEMRAQENPEDQAAEALSRLLHARGISPNYAQTLCQKVFHCTMETASAAQLWRLRGMLMHRKPKAAPKQADPAEQPF